MFAAVLALLLQAGQGLRQAPRPTQPDESQLPRLSLTNRSSLKVRTESWEALNLFEQINLLQGSHYDSITPERGYYIGYTPPLDRLGLPALKMQDGASGFRTTEPGSEGTTTTFPCLLALASTWDEDLVNRVATIMGAEFRGKGANVMLGPAVNVARLAQYGRNWESLSGDDPYLGSRMARAFVRGVQSNNVICAVKQIGFSEQETNRMKYDALVDARTAWELYYPPFEAAIQAGAGAVMCGYNKVNGTYACHSSDVLKRDLREVMGFEGMVISQWGGVRGIDAIESGVDVEMPGRTRNGYGRFNLNQLVTVDPKVIHEASIHVRKAIFGVGLDKGSSCTPPGCGFNLMSDQRTSARSALARDAAIASVTLLKNDDGILPLDPEKISKMAILGSSSYLIGTGQLTNADYMSGGGSGHVNWNIDIQTPLEAIKQRIKWTSDIEILTIPQTPNLEAMTKLKQVADADVVVVFAAQTASETLDRWTLQLDDFADDFIRSVGLLGKPTIVLMQTPGPVLTPWRNEPHVKAVANLFLGGEGTGRAWAGLLFGDYSPSGKLATMFPATEYDVIPPTYDLTVNYTEGLFTSYRNRMFKAAYSFGHGLSFTQFTISAPKQVQLNCTGVACVKVTVANIGNRAGAEVPQAYVEFAPELREPKIVLKGFKKVYLRSGESEDVVFSFTERDLSVYRPEFGWTPQRVVRVHVGSSSTSLGDPVIVHVK